MRVVLEDRAASDERVVAAALVGSLAADQADAWSDIDLALGVDDDHDPMVVLRDWTDWLRQEHDAVHLLDWPVPPATYRVLLLPDGLQVDLSVSSASDFTRRSERFRPLFGQHRTEEAPPATREEAFAYAVLFAVETSRDIARGRLWQAQHFLSQARYHCLTLACLNRELDTRNGRGFDLLPPEVVEHARLTLVADVTHVALHRALASALSLVRQEGVGLHLEQTLSPVLDGLVQRRT
jgi:predicted nucleotidyltransferase